jgi:hypothetical protein
MLEFVRLTFSNGEFPSFSSFAQFNNWLLFLGFFTWVKKSNIWPFSYFLV